MTTRRQSSAVRGGITRRAAVIGGGGARRLPSVVMGLGWFTTALGFAALGAGLWMAWEPTGASYADASSARIETRHTTLYVSSVEASVDLSADRATNGSPDASSER